MKVLQLHVRYRQPGGEDAVVAAEAELLRAGGHEVVSHYVDNPGNTIDAVLPATRSAWNPKAARAVQQLAQRHRPDVAHVHNTFFALSPAVLSALRRAGVPTVVTLHNYRLVCVNSLLYRDGHPCTLCVGSHPWHGVVHRCYRDSAAASAVVAAGITLHRARDTWKRDVDAFVALTDAARQIFLVGGLPPEKIRIKPNFAPDPGPRPRPAAESSRVLYVGRLAHGKGVEVLLEAWTRRPPTGLELVVVGDGPLRADLERRAPSTVIFLGHRPPQEVQQLMLSSRALVFPSVWYEPFGLVLIEALACGLAVVGSDLPGTREILEPAAPELLVRPGDPDALAAALQRSTDDNLVGRASAWGRLRYERAFTSDVNLPMLVGIYESVLGGA